VRFKFLRGDTRLVEMRRRLDGKGRRELHEPGSSFGMGNTKSWRVIEKRAPRIAVGLNVPGRR
jgi:hypothetical protein